MDYAAAFNRELRRQFDHDYAAWLAKGHMWIIDNASIVASHIFYYCHEANWADEKKEEAIQKGAAVHQPKLWEKGIGQGNDGLYKVMVELLTRQRTEQSGDAAPPGTNEQEKLAVLVSEKLDNDWQRLTLTMRSLDIRQLALQSELIHFIKETRDGIKPYLRKTQSAEALRWMLERDDLLGDLYTASYGTTARKALTGTPDNFEHFALLFDDIAALRDEAAALSDAELMRRYVNNPDAPFLYTGVQERGLFAAHGSKDKMLEFLSEERREELNAIFQQRLEEHFQEQVTRWHAMSGAEVVEMSREVTCVKDVYAAMSIRTFSEEDLEAIVTLPDPLQALAGAWEDYCSNDIYQSINDVVWNTRNGLDPDPDSPYYVPAVLPSEEDEQPDMGMAGPV